MSSGARITLKQGQALSAAIAAELAPVCDRVEVVGSVRRCKLDVGDLEILVIPATEPDGLFGTERKNLLMPRLQALCEAGRLVYVMGAERMRQYEVPALPGLKLDLFIVTPETWGVQCVIRTGSAEFSKACVTPRDYGGRLRNGLKVQDGRVFDLVEQRWRETPEERDFLALCGGWVDPISRRDGSVSGN